MTRDEIENVIADVTRSLSTLIDRDAIPAAIAIMAPLWDRREAGVIGEYVIRGMFSSETEFRRHVEAVAYEAWAGEELN